MRGKTKIMKLEKVGELEYVVLGWDRVKDRTNDDIKAIEILKQFVTEKLKGTIVDGECNDDEAFHILVNDTVFHVCFVDPVEVRIFPEDEVINMG